jgi:hypothetical protein
MVRTSYTEVNDYREFCAWLELILTKLMLGTGIYIDAIEWVQITNTRGMSQFADGGIVGTKPYVSSELHRQDESLLWFLFYKKSD